MMVHRAQPDRAKARGTIQRIDGRAGTAPNIWRSTWRPLSGAPRTSRARPPVKHTSCMRRGKQIESVRGGRTTVPSTSNKNKTQFAGLRPVIDENNLLTTFD